MHNLKQLRLNLLVLLNTKYPDAVDELVLKLVMQQMGFKASILKEIPYLVEQGLATRHAGGSSSVRITARGRDFLHGYVMCDGVASPGPTDYIGEPSHV